MKVLSLYCGAGGLDEGLKQAGFKTTLAIDINKDACETMKLNHDCEVINGKVSDYENSFDDFDIIIGVHLAKHLVIIIQTERMT